MKKILISGRIFEHVILRNNTWEQLLQYLMTICWKWWFFTKYLKTNLTSERQKVQVLRKYPCMVAIGQMWMGRVWSKVVWKVWKVHSPRGNKRLFSYMKFKWTIHVWGMIVFCEFCKSESNKWKNFPFHDLMIRFEVCDFKKGSGK